MSAKFRNAGQVCIAANVILVHKDVEHDFVAIMAEKCKMLKFGDPLSNATIGPIINSRGMEKIEEQVSDAISVGGVIHCGGSKADQYHFEPTIITNVPTDAQCLQTETFGPVCAIKVRHTGTALIFIFL